MPRVRGLEEVLARHTGASQRATIFPENFREQPGPATSSPLVRTIDSPQKFKLPMSVDFNRNAFDVALAAAIGATATITSFQMPPTFVGFLQIFGIFILSPTAVQDVTFTVRINGAPVEGWDNIQFPPGVANFVVQNFSELQVRIPDSALVTLTASNGSANAWTIGGKLSGWYHPLSEEKRIYGSL